MKSWIQTSTGQQYYPFSPWRTKPDIEAIAHQLAQTNRYNGACDFPLSVGQHSYEGAIKILKDGYDNATALAFLMHDAPEPFGFCDLVTPVKYGDDRPILGRIFVCLHQHYEKKIHKEIMSQYGIKQDAFTLSIVKKYDRAIVADECNSAMVENGNLWELSEPLGIVIKEKDWRQVKEEFLTLFYKLSGERRA